MNKQNTEQLKKIEEIKNKLSYKLCDDFERQFGAGTEVAIVYRPTRDSAFYYSAIEAVSGWLFKYVREMLQDLLTKTTPHLISSDEIKREAVIGFVKYCRQFDLMNREEDKQRFAESCLREMELNIDEYLTQSKEGGE